MATLLYRAPATKSLKLTSAGVNTRVRPYEYFLIDSTDTATIDDLLAQGFDTAEEPLIPNYDKLLADPDLLHPHNAFALSDAANEVNTITADATAASGGTFTLTVNGQTTAAIAFDADAAAVQAALEALSNVAPGDVAAVQTAGTDLGDNSAIVTLTWGGAFAGMNVTITATMAGLTGNVHVLATSTQGG
jgi:hypothetical protein